MIHTLGQVNRLGPTSFFSLSMICQYFTSVLESNGSTVELTRIGIFIIKSIVV